MDRFHACTRAYRLRESISESTLPCLEVDVSDDVGRAAQRIEAWMIETGGLHTRWRRR